VCLFPSIILRDILTDSLFVLARSGPPFDCFWHSPTFFGFSYSFPGPSLFSAYSLPHPVRMPCPSPSPAVMFLGCALAPAMDGNMYRSPAYSPFGEQDRCQSIRSVLVVTIFSFFFSIPGPSHGLKSRYSSLIGNDIVCPCNFTFALEAHCLLFGSDTPVPSGH
jgi:hypothetical protein